MRWTKERVKARKAEVKDSLKAIFVEGAPGGVVDEGALKDRLIVKLTEFYPGTQIIPGATSSAFILAKLVECLLDDSFPDN